MLQLELLAPARDLSIGIAAIDCGADAVYVAGPAFGARQAAGNSVEDIRALCDHAHRFGVRIFVTLNTILFDEELPEARRLLRELAEAGADAFIVQDLAVPVLAQQEGISVPLHASTQCAIRTPEDARRYEALGFGRLVPERQLSLEEIRAIRAAVDCELECFVHGALCVCYSGQCYLSEAIGGRSANRGACMQACRSRYDLEDAEGHVLVRDKALLSLKDLSLPDRLGDLARAGVTSFKIEGRLKNIAYVRNSVRAFSLALDALVRQAPDRYVRASFGRVEQSFQPDLSRTFNRGYTSLFLDGKKGAWASWDTPKSVGGRLGTLVSLRSLGSDRVEGTIRPEDKGLRLHNGDGFAFVHDGRIVGFRGDVCEGLRFQTRDIPGLRPGVTLYRNHDIDFEREMARHPGVRTLGVFLFLCFPEPGEVRVSARREDGQECSLTFPCSREEARDAARMRAMLAEGLSKRGGVYRFSLQELTADGPLPLMSAASINEIRRSMAEALDQLPPPARPLALGRKGTPVPLSRPASYKENVANALAWNAWEALGSGTPEPAYEIAHPSGAELMRTRYCIRRELGWCLKEDRSGKDRSFPRGPLFLRNQGRRFALGFDCAACEMTVREA